MEAPVLGLCPFCLRQKQLEKSHYLGRALHLLSQDDGKAVFMTPQRIELSLRQIWAHLLCGECEDILAANESYAHQWINRNDRFPLLERLKRSRAGALDARHRCFDGASGALCARHILAGERKEVENARPANHFPRSGRTRRTDSPQSEARRTVPNGLRFAYDRLHGSRIARLDLCAESHKRRNVPVLLDAGARNQVHARSGR